jgi:hypothetical protein
MVLSLGQKVVGFITSPTATFDATREDTVGNAFGYYIAILVIYAVLIAIISIIGFSALAVIEGILGASFQEILELLLGAALGPLLAIGFFIVALVGGIIIAIIDGIWLHIWAYLFGGRNGVGQTIKAVMYGLTPFFLLGWLSFIEAYGIGAIIAAILWIWAFILVIIGIRQLQELSTAKAVLAAIIALIIPGIIIAAIRLIV